MLKVEQNLILAIEDSIKAGWDLPALGNYKVNDYTYGQVGEQILKLHLMFEKCGIKQGDKVALIGRSVANWGIVYLATITYGATIVPILPDFRPSDVHNIVTHSDSLLLFCGDGVLPTLDGEQMPNIYAIFNIANWQVTFERGDHKVGETMANIDSLFAQKYPDGINASNLKFPVVNNSNIGVISYTSGTTGFSKGVVLTLQSLMVNVDYAMRHMPLFRGDKIVSVLPLAHAYGCAFEFLWPFTIGAHITFLGRNAGPTIMMEAFQTIKPHLLLFVPLIIEKVYKKTIQPLLNKPAMKVMMHIPGINTILRNKIKASLTAAFGGRFREMVCGGAPFNREVELFLRKLKFNFTVGYGMTECGPLITYANWRESKVGSCGQLIEAMEISIDSSDPEKQSGEILVKGDNVMLGYYKNQEATDKAIDKNGWLHTGDLGVLDKDGFLFIKGRSKSMILGPSGENIYPEEIEAKLNNLPYVIEQVVVADKKNKLVALVYADTAQAEKDGVDLLQVMEQNKVALNNELPKFMQVSRIELRDSEFEKTPKQSIKRFLYEIKD